MKNLTTKFYHNFASICVLALFLIVFIPNYSYAEGEIIPVLDERCIVNILNGSAKIDENGTFALSTPLPDGIPYRARVICDQGDQLFHGESVLIHGVPNDLTDTGEISFDSNHPIPVSLNLGVSRTQLIPNSPSSQIEVTALLPDGSSSPFTASESGTVYLSSNSEIASVTENGLVTGHKKGEVIISVRHEGALASIQFEVLFPNDADGDGLEDEYELANGLDPNNPNDAILDLDNDGLSNLEEFLLGTSPVFADTDGDTISDYDEAQAGTDPLNPDTDSDGIVDGEELLRGTDPLNADTDNDGISDGVEVEFGLDPTNFTASTTLVGRIIDDSGAAVANASVVAFDTFSALSDVTGAFEITSVPVVAGDISLLARIIRGGQVLDGESSPVAPVPAGLTDFGNITIAEIVGRLSGVVYSPRGELVVGARVTVKLKDSGEERFSNADFQGRYQFDSLSRGVVDIVAQDPRTGLNGLATTTINPEAAQSLNVTLSAFGTIKGIAYQADGLTPVGPDIQIRLASIGGHHSAQTTTNAFGEYGFEFVPMGEYQVDSLGNDGNRGRTIAVLSGTTQVLDANIIYLGKGTVRGFVETASGQRLSNLPVEIRSRSLFGGRLSGTTDAVGEFVIENVFVGDFSLSSTDSVRKISGNIIDDVEFDGEFVDVVVTMQPTGSIIGQVVQSDGTSFVTGATITLSTGASTTADASGNYRFDFVPLGSYTLEAKTAEGDIGRADVAIANVDEVVTQGVQLNGLGRINVAVSNSKSTPVSGVQVSVETGSPYHKKYTGITDAQGRVTLNNILAGSLTVSAFDPIDRLGGSISSTLLPGEVVDMSLNLEPAGDIFGVIYQSNGVTPAANIRVELNPGGLRTTTSADGSYRFNMLALSKSPYAINVFDSKGVLRGSVSDLQLIFDGEQIEQDFTITGNGSVSGVVYNPGGTVAGGATVTLSSQVPGSQRKVVISDSQGAYFFDDVPVGGFGVEASIIPLRFAGNASGQIEFDGDKKVIDIAMLENQLPSSIKTVATLFDANNFQYAVQRDGSIQDGTRSVFRGDGNIFRGAGRLDIFRDNQLHPFVNTETGSVRFEENNREVVVSAQNGSGLTVTRKVYVPLEGYFSRHIESLTNPGSEPITVDLRLDSHYRIATAARTNSSGTTNTVQIPVGIISTSSGDAFLSTTGDADRWVVLDDDRDLDPFLDNNVPAVGHIYDGEGAQLSASELEFLSGTSGQFNRMRNRWSNIIVAPGQTLSIMHFIVEQTGRAAAIASALRLGQLPPEALTGLNESERASILNFTVPLDGVSALNPLPDLLNTVVGTVFEGDGTTPVTTTVSFQSDHPLYRRIRQLSSDQNGQYTLSGLLADGNSSLAVPADSYRVFAEHPQSLVESDRVSGDFSGGSPSTSDIVFSSTGQITGTVRRFDGVVASFGKIELVGASLPRTLTYPIQEDGRYRFGGIPAGLYTLIATLPNPDGTGIAGSITADVVVGTEIIRDITLSEVGGITGRVLTGGGEPVVNLLVELAGSEFTREVRTDSGGLFRFLDAPLDTYTLSAKEPATRIQSEAQVTVTDNGLFTQDLNLIPVGKITLNTVFSDTRIAEGSIIQIQRTPIGSFFVTAGVTDRNGALTINGVPQGEFIIRAIHPLNSEIIETFSASLTAHGEIIPVSVVLPNDLPPTVVLSSPLSGQVFLRGSQVEVQANVSDDYGIRRVEFLLNGEVVNSATTAPYIKSIQLDTATGITNADVGVLVTDKAGNQVTQAVQVVVNDDSEPPTLSIQSPLEGFSIIEGQVLSFSANAQDNVAVSSVKFLVDGQLITTDLSEPYSGTYSIPVDYADAGAKVLTLTVEANDTIGNTTTDSLKVTVQPDLLPTIVLVDSPVQGESIIEGGELFISANARDDVQVTRVELVIEGEVIQTRFNDPYQFNFNAPTLATVTNPVDIVLRAFDTQGQVASTVPVEIVVTRDNPPTVTILTPTANENIIEGTLITLSANAGDDLGVTRVDFYESNKLIGSDTLAPYEISTRISSGVGGETVSFTARAIDTLGQSADDSRSIIRGDDLVPPSVQITAPQDGSIVTVGPSDVAIVIDTSGSAGNSSGADVDGDGLNDSILKAEVFAAKQLLNFLNPETTNIAIVDFSSSAILVRGLSNDFADLDVALDQILASGAGGGTNFDAAMRVATNELIGSNSRSFATSVQLFLSDGSASTPTAEIERARNGAVIVNSFAIGFGANTSILQLISEGTGGVATAVPDASQIVELLPSIVLFGIDALITIADAQDDVAVREVEFQVTSGNGLIQNQQIDTTAPYSLASALPPIEEQVNITVLATARDYGDNAVDSASVSVTLLPTENVPSLVSLEPEFVIPGALITVRGQFLVANGSTQPSETSPDEIATTLVFYNGVEITPELVDKITIKFLLPSNATSGELYAIVDGVETNRLTVSIDSDQDGLTDEQEAANGTNPLVADSDGDGLTDGEEVNIYSTNPLQADSDNDGLSDSFEVNNNLNPNDVSDASADNDNDGLTNLEEFGGGTDPNDSDSDNDGLNDGQEVNTYSTNPLDNDSDNDSLSDGDEVLVHQTNPLSTDTDGDSLNDGYEVANNLDPNLDDANLDADTDGLSNLEESQLGTNPQLADTDNDGLNDGEEVNTYLTNPLDSDSDNGGDLDGFEIANNTDPLNPNDDVSVTLSRTLFDGSNYRWDIQRNGSINDGTSDAYDGGLILSVNGNGFNNFNSAVSEDAQREITIGSELIGGLRVSRKVYIPTSNNFARYLEIIENTTASDIQASLRIFSNFGSDSSTIVVDTSSGDLLAANDDTYIISDDSSDGGGDPTLIHLWGNSDSSVLASSVVRSGDSLTIDFAITIPANGRSILMHLASQNPNRSTAIANASVFEALPDSVLEGMAIEEREAVVNFKAFADSDNDGLSDSRELLIGTDPNNADSDGDGLPDGFEVTNGLDPLDLLDAGLDADNDGLTNLDEFVAGTDPANADSDADGLSDGDEVNTYASNPLVTDTDSDGISDGEEVNTHNTNPVSADTDNDGLSDQYEVLNGLNPNLDDTALDADGDGLTNLEEFTAGTDPQVSDTDNDGLSDFEELTTYSTDPLNPDTDGGGDSDGFEVSRNTDPLNPDDDPTVRLPISLQDGSNYQWFIQRDGSMGDPNFGDPPSGIYDSGLRLIVNNKGFNNFTTAVSEDARREFDIGNTIIGDLNVSRKVYVSGTHNFSRYLEIIENTTLADIQASIEIQSNFGSDVLTTVEGTSSGDLFVANDDTYVITDDGSDGSGAPTLLHLWGSSNSNLLASSISRFDDNLFVGFDITIPANGRVIIMHLASQNSDRVSAIANAGLFEALPDYVLAGMTLDEKDAIVNFVAGLDSDNDGLSDSREQLLGTDPNNPDTDNDGLPDGFEVGNGFDPLDSADAALDADNDGLSNLEEFVAGTDPTIADSDSDGLSDGDEVNTHSTNPLNKDSDADQLLDGFEVAFGFDPLAAGETNLDPDLDTLTNLQEQKGNTNPLLADTDGDGVNDNLDFAPNDPNVQSAPDILLVDDSDFPGSVTKYVEALDSLGLSYTVWNKAVDGLPDRILISQHRLTIWFNGETQWLNSAEEVTVSNYLQGGGCFLLSSQDYHFTTGFTPFMQDYLGLQSVNDDTLGNVAGPIVITGNGGFYSSPVPYNLLFEFENYGDALQVGQAQAIFFNGVDNYGVNLDTGTFASTFLSFPLEAVETIADRADIISRVFNSCSYIHDLSVPGDSVPPDDDNQGGEGGLPPIGRLKTESPDMVA